MSTALLEKYDSKPGKISRKSCYIRRSLPERLLTGLIPFPDQDMYFDALTYNTGMILTGKSGVGKRTLISGYVSEFCCEDDNDFCFDHYLDTDACKLAEMDQAQAEAELRELFDELTGYCEGIQDDEKESCLVNFGDVRPFTENNRLCRIFSDGMKKLREKGTGFVVAVGVYDGAACELPGCIRGQFICCKISVPDREERIQFFEEAMKYSARFIRNTAGVDMMADSTDGMTFSELWGVVRLMQIFLKVKFSDEEKTDGDLSDLDISPVIIEENEFNQLADSMRDDQPAASAVDMSSIADVLAALPQASPTAAAEEKPEDPYAFLFGDDPDDPL